MGDSGHMCERQSKSRCVKEDGKRVNKGKMNKEGGDVKNKSPLIAYVFFFVFPHT